MEGSRDHITSESATTEFDANVENQRLLSSDWDNKDVTSSDDDIQDGSGEEDISTWRRKFGADHGETESSEHEKSGELAKDQRSGISLDQPTPYEDDVGKTPGTSDAPSDVNDDHEFVSGIDDLPLFANEKNKRLHARVRSKEKRFHQIVTELSETNSRVEIMTEHLKNVKQELVHTQELHNAKKKEVESEEHLKQLAEREIGRLTQEMRRLDAECAELNNKLNTVQTYLFKGNEKMDSFQLQMNWNQDEIEQWTRAAKQKEEDSLALEKYRRADESRIKELILDLEKLTKSYQHHNRLVEDENTETQAKQIELDRISSEFHQLHQERQKIIKQWQETIEAIGRRDEEIATASVEYARNQQALRQNQEVLGAQKQRINAQEQENNDLHTLISAKERQQSKTNQELQESVSKLQEFRDQVETVKNQLASAVTHMTQQRTNNANKMGRLGNMHIELEQAQNRLKATKKMLESWLNSNLDAESLAKNAEKDLKYMNNDVLRLEKETIQQKEVLFRRSQELYILRQDSATLSAEISGCKANNQNLKAKAKALEQQVLRQQELIYNGEFQIQQMERKVARASGERSVEETKALQEQIKVLQAEQERVQSEQSMLITQCKKLEEERRGQERVKRALQKQREELQAQLAQTELENESYLNMLKQTLRSKEEYLVQYDMQSLEVRRLRGIMNARSNEVFTLENRDFQMKKSMEERKKEIQMQRELQRAMNKNIEEERHKLTLELAERESRVRKLHAKFEVLCKSGGYGADQEEGTEGRSQAYYMIRAAQRREELQIEGDDLDNKIRVAEREIKALKKTLRHLESQNSEYRKSFQRVDLAGEDKKKLVALEEQVRDAEDRFFKKKKEVTRIEIDLESEVNYLRELQTRKSSTQESCSQLTANMTQIDKEIVYERQKWKRAVRKLKKQLNEHCKRVYGTTGSKFVKEHILLEMYAQKEITTSLLYTLGQLADEFPEMADTLQIETKKHNLHIPKTRPGRTANIGRTSYKNHESNLKNSLPRPMSARSNQSDTSRSTESKFSQRSSRSSASQSKIGAPINRVQIGF
uniref:Flagella associated protein putative n=1 Tax=Albugo laibachii Nc14 TaxID=890382 RepID=F0WAQ3_9STRA|nr:flagella associated protein putative [Albugo laibachii Nc14]|eukprot:CCA18224.1 flagella associated protein putative [Albugo laibachii Nc14]